MRLILVRHGETEENVAKINQGHMPGKLTKQGIEQAKKLALRLKDEKIDKIFVSDLKRCVDTAAEIIKFHPKAEVIYEPAVREQNLGIYEGKPHGSMRKAAEAAGVHPYEFKPEGGESFPELRKRIRTFIDALIKKEHNKTVLIVSHGGPIRQFLIDYLKAPHDKWDDYSHANCAVTILEIDEKGHEIHALRCVKHLA
jgi:broad specificity phosphatase PhoE